MAAHYSAGILPARPRRLRDKAAVERTNSREMRRLGMSRCQLFDTVERPAMQALPQDDHEFAEWHLARVGIDYHIEVQGFFYSVPHALVREQVDARATAGTVEVFHRGRRVAAHARRYSGPRHGTQPEHMPSAHRRYAEWTPEHLQRQAHGIGPNTKALILAVLARRPHTPSRASAPASACCGCSAGTVNLAASHVARYG